MFHSKHQLHINLCYITSYITLVRSCSTCYSNQSALKHAASCHDNVIVTLNTDKMFTVIDYTAQISVMSLLNDFHIKQKLMEASNCLEPVGKRKTFKNLKL